MLNSYGRTPEDKERDNLRVKRLNDERVCKKKLAIKNRLAELQHAREDKAIERGEL